VQSTYPSASTDARPRGCLPPPSRRGSSMNATHPTGLTRRNCLKLGLGALLGGGLARALAARAASQDEKTITPTANACILIWLDPGPSPYETFDPKPDAPKEIRGEFGTVATRIKGVHFSEHLPKLANLSDHLAIVRSIRHDQGNHGAGNHYMM